ncbi:MAG: hypothetical protein L0H63_14790 [Nitrococcus sp.]|nr:hypothetical protein [Nitrococcus sp.]
MTYLNYAQLEALDVEAFRNRLPYPWCNPEDLLTEPGYLQLLQTLPDVSLFTSTFGIQRSHGQQPHDRFALEYREDLEVAAPWHAFVEELRGSEYSRFLRRLFGRGGFKLRFHWHYTPRGCSVSPHCDAKRKLGSHIFYFNTADDWDPTWGGETLILDDRDRFKRNSAPAFADFDQAFAGESLGNRSLLFQRQGNSWHGVHEIRAPEGHYRKVFIVVINDRLRSGLRRISARLRGEAIRDY